MKSYKNKNRNVKGRHLNTCTIYQFCVIGKHDTVFINLRIQDYIKTKHDNMCLVMLKSFGKHIFVNFN